MCMKEPPQLVDAVLSYRTAGVPLLDMPFLGGCADNVENTAVAYLLRTSLLFRKEEEGREEGSRVGPAGLPDAAAARAVFLFCRPRR